MMIKICGLTSFEMAEFARDKGADFLGFVFAPSKRRIQVEAAINISKQLRGVRKVGVFVNAPLAQVKEIVERCQLDYAQLHGEESADYSLQLGCPVIKAVRVNQGLNICELNSYPAEYLLLDSFVAGQQGGTGVAFDWSSVAKWRKEIVKPLLVAGGLHKENVLTATTMLQPQGVDVSGGVESQGQKDKGKIDEFIQMVRRKHGG